MNQEILKDVSSMAGKILLQTAGPSSPQSHGNRASKALPSILDQVTSHQDALVLASEQGGQSAAACLSLYLASHGG